MKIVLANDHGGINLKLDIMKYLIKKNINYIDLGVNKKDSVDYPDFAYSLAKVLNDENVLFGILICGSGIGISIAANRYKNIRAALCHDITTSRLSRQHNNANVIVFGGGLIKPKIAVECLDIFLNTNFENDARHNRRIEKLNNPPLIN